MHDSDPTGIVAQKIEALRKPGGRSRAGHDNHLFSVTPCRYQNSLAYTAEGIPTEPLHGRRRAADFTADAIAARYEALYLAAVRQ
ncbi:hypothetical protein SR41_08350 [Sphingomonas melonis]|uniref:Uncharacterized protein n=1 Tax=Sphingomonas melonis TaxID=152682 RepID=A0A0D1ML49_9SPHN|nr:hypothetical protein SR41_08350 [Sphingomonas melonis]